MKIGESIRRLIRVSFVLVFLALLVASPVPVNASGSVDTCNETSFNVALASGGTVTFNCSGTITLTSTKIINSDITIDGNGNSVILDGGGSVQLFSLSAGQTLELHDLTLQNGYAATDGGAVYMPNGGTLIIEDSIVRNHTAADDGGAIYADDTGETAVTVSIHNSVFIGNQSVGDDGGAIWIDGNTTHVALLEISNSTFEANHTALDDAASDGGVINVLNNTTINLEGNTFSNNHAGDDGGVVLSISNTSLNNYANNTFSGNSAGNASGTAAAEGGALHIEFANLVHNAFVNNTIVGGANKYGSAIAWDASDAAVVSRANIFTGNTGGNGECAFETTTGVYGSNNLGGDGSCNNPAGGGAVINFDSTLQDNGGPTETHALLGGSNAIDTASVCTYASSGTNNLFTHGDSITQDQRGGERPVSTACDIGAYEFGATPNAVVLQSLASATGSVMLAVIAFGAVLAGGGMFAWKRRK